MIVLKNEARIVCRPFYIIPCTVIFLIASSHHVWLVRGTSCSCGGGDGGSRYKWCRVPSAAPVVVVGTSGVRY